MKVLAYYTSFQHLVKNSIISRLFTEVFIHQKEVESQGQCSNVASKVNKYK